jgi:DNA-binding transcriptional MerR regulator
VTEYNRRRPYSVATEAEKEEARILRASGLSISRIAQRLNRSDKAIRIWTNPHYAEYVQRANTKHKEMRRLNKVAMTAEQIALRTKLARVAREEARETGLPIREAYAKYGIKYYNARELS